MPRTAKAVTALSVNSAVDSAAAGVYTTIDAALVTNGLSITGAGAGAGALVLHVKNTAVAAKNVTVRAGSHQGVPGNAELVASVPAAGERMIRLGDSVLFEQTDETYHVDFEAGTTGSIAVLRVP